MSRKLKVLSEWANKRFHIESVSNFNAHFNNFDEYCHYRHY